MNETLEKTKFLVCPRCGAKTGSQIKEMDNGDFCCDCGCVFWPNKPTDPLYIQLEDARSLLNTGDYTKAEGAYQDLINTWNNAKIRNMKYPMMAHWEKIQAHFGIRYIVDDSGKSIATLDGTNCDIYASISDNDTIVTSYDEYKDYNKFWSEEIRSAAAHLDKLICDARTGLAEVPETDIFICAKVNDVKRTETGRLVPAGRRTKDANEYLYKDMGNGEYRTVGILKQIEDIRVSYFYCEKEHKKITSDSQIFSALTKSRLLVIVTSKLAYLNTPWMRSEWRRWISYIKAGKKAPESIILVDIDNTINPYNLPSEMQVMSVYGQNHFVTKITSKELEDSVRYRLNAIHEWEKEKGRLEALVNAKNDARILERAKQLVILGDFEEAVKYCDGYFRVICEKSKDPSYAQNPRTADEAIINYIYSFAKREKFKGLSKRFVPNSADKSIFEVSKKKMLKALSKQFKWDAPKGVQRGSLADFLNAHTNDVSEIFVDYLNLFGYRYDYLLELACFQQNG